MASGSGERQFVCFGALSSWQLGKCSALKVRAKASKVRNVFKFDV
jgi:hypothetical protein